MMTSSLRMVTLEQQTQCEGEVVSLEQRREELIYEIKHLIVARIRVSQRLTKAERRFRQIETKTELLMEQAEAHAKAISD